MSSEQITTVEPKPEAPKPTPNVPAPIRMGERGLKMSSSSEILRLADMVLKGGMAPQSYQTVGAVASAMFMGMELGLPPVSALRTIAVIKGTPSIWGKGAYALAMDHPLYEDHEVTWQVGNDEETEFPPEYSPGYTDDKGNDVPGDKIPNDLKCICRAWRKGKEKPFSQKFSVADAKTAGLWMRSSKGGNSMPWSSYWSTMLYHKAVGNALEMAVPEAFIGLVNAPRSEVEKITEDEEPSAAAMPTVPMAIKPPDSVEDYIDVEAEKPQEKPRDPAKEPVVTTSPPKPTKEERQPEPPPEDVESDQGPIEEAEQPPAKKEKPNVKAILANFHESHPHHTRARVTVGNDKTLYVVCDCEAKFEVKTIGSVTVHERINKGDGSCDPKPIDTPAELQEPAAPKLSATGQAFLRDLDGATISSISEAFDILLARSKKATEQGPKEENAYILEMHIRAMVAKEKTSVSVLRASKMLNEAKSQLDEDRASIVRQYLNSVLKAK